jgi:hypothetical protein
MDNIRFFICQRLPDLTIHNLSHTHRYHCLDIEIRFELKGAIPETPSHEGSASLLL